MTFEIILKLAEESKKELEDFIASKEKLITTTSEEFYLLGEHLDNTYSPDNFLYYIESLEKMEEVNSRLYKSKRMLKEYNNIIKKLK